MPAVWAALLAACSFPALAQQHPEAAAIVPYSAVRVIETDVAVPGGGSRHASSRMFVARDSQGRLLYSEAAPGASTAGPGPRAVITNVANRSHTTLDSARHHAMVENSLLRPLAGEPPLEIPQPPPPAGYVSVTTRQDAPEDLGTRNIAGVRARGTLNTRHDVYVGGTEPGTYTRTTEEWRSVSGDILLEESVHDQRGVEVRVHVENLRLAPPPPSLFLVPSGDAVTEVGETAPLRDQWLAEARAAAAALTGLAQARAYLAIADAERLVRSLPDQMWLMATPDQRQLGAMAAADAMAAFLAAANADEAPPARLTLAGQTQRDELEAGAMMIAGWETAPAQRAQALNAMIAAAQGADPPRAGIYNAILQYWYADPPSGAPGAGDLIRQCVEADGSFPYFGLMAVLQPRARYPLPPDERDALVRLAYETAAKEGSNSHAYGAAAMALGDLHARAPGLDPQLADTLVAMLNRPDALRNLRFQTEAQLLDLLRSIAPDRAEQIATAARTPPPLPRQSSSAPEYPRGQAVISPDDAGQVNDLVTQMEAQTAVQPQAAAQAARAAAALLSADLDRIASDTDPVWIGPADRVAAGLQRLGLYDEAAALEAKTFAGIAADATLIQLNPDGLPNLPGSGTTIEDHLLELAAALCLLDTRMAASGAAAMPGWFKPLVLATIVQHAAMM